jgi:Tol biopolymer transport system component
MGEVYRARDAKLGRDVALKILPAEMAGDPERLARLRREARMLAALNHPHIAAIHDIEESEGKTGLVLELVEGPTLADRLLSGPLPVREALPIAIQIADALESAHRKGIVHRDLKPANIKITPEGSVKVLDFGLAKVFRGETREADVSLPTRSAAETLEGHIVGTAAYMSPEQARGHEVDERTDVWAFGCVLFEMLAGRRAFAGQSVSDTIAAVLEHEPPWEALPEFTPATVRHLLNRCLRKDAHRRLHDVADARIELEDSMASPAAPAPSPRRWFGSPVWLGVAVTLALLAGAVALIRASRESATRDLRITRLTDLPGLEEFPAISPDGRSVAFSAAVGEKRQIFLRLIAGGAPLQITQDPVDHLYPRWTADSSTLVYFAPAAPGEAQGNIWQISALGGVPNRVASTLGDADVSGIDGRLAFFRLAGNGIQLVAAAADTSSLEIVAEFAPTTYHLYPRWSPDGRWIAFQRGDSIRFDLFVVPARGGEPRQVTHDNNMIGGFAWMPDSRSILYSSSRGSTMPYLPTLSLWRVALEGGGVERMSSGETSYGSPDVARSGATVVSRQRLESDIWKFPFEGSPAENVRGAVRVTRQTGQVLTPTAGPDDREIAFLSDSGGHANLWVVDAETGSLRQITHEREPSVSLGVPVWSPDGSAIAFVSSRGNEGLTFGVWLVNPDGSNLRNVANPGLGPAWSHDGRWLYYSTRRGPAAPDAVLRKVAPGGGTAITVTKERLRNVIGSDGTTLYYTFERPLVDGTPEFEIRAASPEDGPFRVVARIPASRVPLWQIVNPALSPDGKWLAQALTDGLTTNIWTLSTSTGEWRQITDFGGRATFIARRVSWSSDGGSIFAAVGEGDADIVMLEGITDVLPAQ